MKEQKNLVPKLRFPEFRGTEGWHVNLFEKLFVIGNGRDHKHLSPGDFPVYGSGGYMRSVDEYLYDGESVCIGRKGTINNPIFLTGKFWTVDTLFYTHSFKQCLPKFIWAIFQQIDWLKHNEAGGIPSLSKSNIEKIKTAIPSVTEQQKIADCLSSLDELIAAQARKVEALKTHKKGLMQQLFPREGETLPRLRLPEFQNVGEWETKRVDEWGDVLAGKALAVNAPGPLRHYLRTKNVLDGAIDVQDVLAMPMTDAEFKRFEILDGDVLLNEGQSLHLVGRAAIYRSELGHRCAMQNQLLRFRASSSTCPEFAAQAFRQCQQDGTFASIATQTTSVAHLGSSRFSALKLTWPPSLAEQERIADHLTALDALITTATQALDTLKAHKQGLMQQLFPSAEEAAT
jgi:type I restriction enzyme, S subunit